jgi:hypothetical protein
LLGTALFLRKMLTNGEINHEGIDRLLNAIRELGVKSKAFMEVVDSLPSGDRHYLSHGGIRKLKARAQPEQQRIAAQINAFLDTHPATRVALGLLSQ